MSDEEKAFMVGIVDQRTGKDMRNPFPENEEKLRGAWLDGFCFSIEYPLVEENAA